MRESSAVRLWTLPFVLMISGTALLFIAFYALYPTLPLFITRLGGNDTQVGLAMGVFMFASVAFRPIAGGLLDRFGRRAFVTGGLLLFGVTMYLYGQAGSIFGLLWLRALHGMSWAFASTAVQTAITDMIPPERRGEGLGWLGMAMTVAMAVGPAIGLWVAQHLSYQTLFLGGAGITAVALLLTFGAKFPPHREPHQPRADRGGEPQSPTLQRTRLSLKALLPIMVSVFFVFGAYSSITTFLPLFTPVIHVTSDLFFMAFAATLLLMRPLGGKLSDRLGEAVIIPPALAIAAGGLVALSLATGFPGVLLAAVLFGIGFGAAQPVLLAAALRLAGGGRNGAANAAVTTATDLGIGLGAIGLGSVAQATSYRGVFVVAAIAVGLSLVVFTALARRRLVART